MTDLIGSPEDLWTLLTLLLFILFLLWFLWMLRQLARTSRSGGGGTGSCGAGAESFADGPSGGGSSGSDPMRSYYARMQAEREAAERRKQAALEERVRSILTSDEPMLGQRLVRQAGLDEDNLRLLAADPEVVREIVRKLGEEPITILSVAADLTHADFDIEFTEGNERLPALYPTGDVSPAPLTDLGQLGNILPQDRLTDPTSFFVKLVTGEMRVLQPYETQKRRRIMYLLRDVSPSMDEGMADATARHQWARGVMVGLLTQAVRGEAVYLFRNFASKAHKLGRVSTPDEAEALIDELLVKPGQGSGTDIQAALKAAVADIKKEAGSDSSLSDILLISDGESQRPLDPKWLKATFGEDIRLHVAMIGLESPLLKEVATTYRVYS